MRHGNIRVTMNINADPVNDALRDASWKIAVRAISQFTDEEGERRYFIIWGGKRESNPQPSEPQSGALPVELFPPPR
jgi:hypothetical protein